MLALHVALLRLADLLERCSCAEYGVSCSLSRRLVTWTHFAPVWSTAQPSTDGAWETASGSIVGMIPNGMLFCPISIHAIYEFCISSQKVSRHLGNRCSVTYYTRLVCLHEPTPVRSQRCSGCLSCMRELSSRLLDSLFCSESHFETFIEEPFEDLVTNNVYPRHTKP